MALNDPIKRTIMRFLHTEPVRALRQVAEKYKRREFKPSPRTRLSVVLGSYNRRLLLEAAINSVRNNDIPVPYEIIVVDGGSTDGSIEWLVQQKDIVTIVQHNRGEFRGKPLQRRSWGYFMNLAFKAAQGDWILMISDDCVLLEGALPSSLLAAKKLSQQGRKIGGVAFYFRNWPLEKKYYVNQTIGRLFIVNHGLFSRRALEEIGFANENDYMFYKADGDLSLRIWHAGYEIVECPNAIVEHYFDEAEMMRQSNDALMEHDRNIYKIRWGHLEGKARKIELDYNDPSHTAEAVFGPLKAEQEN